MKAITADALKGFEDYIHADRHTLNARLVLASDHPPTSFTEPGPLATCSPTPTPPPACRMEPIILDQRMLSRRD